MAELKIIYPGFDQHLSAPEELSGQQIDCSSCSKPMTVPTFAEVEEDDEEWVEESTHKSSKLIVGIAAGIALLGVVAFIALGGDDSQEDEPELATPVGMTNEPPRSVPTSGCRGRCSCSSSRRSGSGRGISRGNVCNHKIPHRCRNRSSWEINWTTARRRCVYPSNRTPAGVAWCSGHVAPA